MALTRILAGLFIFTTIIGCTDDKRASQKPGESADIFSSRPIADVPDLYLITLTEPPILKSAVKTGSGWQIDEAAKRAVLNEQATFAAKLKGISSTAEIIFRYHLTINAVAIYAPFADIPEIEALPQVKTITNVRRMARPETLDVKKRDPASSSAVNSASFIGAEAAYAQGITGAGIRVGVLDSGVDYTHSMLGGNGDAAEYAAIDPAQPTPLFPNAKVTGGTDLVGTEFDAASPLPGKSRPRPDPNPLDESGHGSHVAGTIAGIGDGESTYDGVAKDAEIVAIKVFGKDGSTLDAVVIRGFEYALDPNGDLNPDDQLDIVNLSLGGGYGPPQILYSEAVRNLVNAGTVMVGSAGNSGPEDYVVGAPSTSDDALSVAASVDGSEHNWKFPAALFSTPTRPELLVKIVEGAITKPIAEFESPVEGELVDLGFADVDLTPEQAAAVAGKVAFISRGKVPFVDKLRRAQDAGAIGVVTYNNAPGNPIVMGGEGSFLIPGFMITQDLGLVLLEEMKTGPVRVLFNSQRFIEERERIDTIASFSSKGPRSEDNLIKPEITAPGAAIISADFSTGTGAAEMGGTSMAAPHMAGAMALIKQKFPSLSAHELKALSMNTAKVLSGPTGEVPVTLQGAGRVQIDRAIEAKILVEPAALSLGLITLEDTQTVTRIVKVKNISGADLEVTLSTTGTPGLTFDVPASVSVAAGQSAQVTITATFNAARDAVSAAELDGRVYFSAGGSVAAQIPALAIRTLSSRIRTSATVGGPFIPLHNASPREGMALAFNLLGEDEAKRMPRDFESWMGRSCDLQSVGYRILRRSTPEGERQVLQFGFKLYQPVTTWHLCEPVVLVDTNGDGIAEQELAGVSSMGIEGMENFQFASVLLNAEKARAIRAAYEQGLSEGREDALDYTPAALATLPMAPFNNSTLAVIEAPLELVARGADGMIRVQAAALYQYGDNVEGDDYLGTDDSQWLAIAPIPLMHPYYGMEEFTTVPTGGASISLQRGTTPGKLILYYPLNVISESEPGSQFQVLD